MNNCAFYGRLPFELKMGGEEGKEYLFSAISVKKNWKAKEDKYYGEDLINFSAFNHTAKNIAKVGKGGYVILEGRMEHGKDREINGEVKKGELMLKVEKMTFMPKECSGGGNTNTNASAPASAAPAAKPASVNPFSKSAPATKPASVNPFKK